MSKKLKYLKRDGTGDVIKTDEIVGTKPEEYIVRANDLERIKEFMNGKVDSYLNEGADITENDTDWTNETELKTLLTSGEMANIKTKTLGSFAGIVGVLDVAQRITMIGLFLAPDPINDNIGLAEILFDANGKVTSINIFESTKPTVKDLTHLTTQDEIYNEIELGKWYFIKNINGEISYLQCTLKDANNARLYGLLGTTRAQQMVVSFVAKGNNGAYAIGFSTLVVAVDPIGDTDVANKKYVDDAIAKLIANNGLTVSDEPEDEDDGPVDVGYLGRKLEKIKQANSKKKQKVSGDEPEIK